MIYCLIFLVHNFSRLRPHRLMIYFGTALHFMDFSDNASESKPLVVRHSCVNLSLDIW